MHATDVHKYRQHGVSVLDQGTYLKSAEPEDWTSLPRVPLAGFFTLQCSEQEVITRAINVESRHRTVVVQGLLSLVLCVGSVSVGHTGTLLHCNNLCSPQKYSAWQRARPCMQSSYPRSDGTKKNADKIIWELSGEDMDLKLRVP